MERLVESEPASVVAGGVYRVAISASRPEES
jgi:hypothetical protein